MSHPENTSAELDPLRDQLAPARGIFNGLLLSIPLWILLALASCSSHAGTLIDSSGSPVLSGFGLVWSTSELAPIPSPGVGFDLSFNTPIGNSGDLSTVAKCQGADSGSTIATFALTRRTELNPVVNALAPRFLGRVGGILVGTIAGSWLIYEVLAWINNRNLNTAAAVLACASAARNLYVINH